MIRAPKSVVAEVEKIASEHARNMLDHINYDWKRFTSSRTGLDYELRGNFGWDHGIEGTSFEAKLTKTISELLTRENIEGDRKLELEKILVNRAGRKIARALHTYPSDVQLTKNANDREFRVVFPHYGHFVFSNEYTRDPYRLHFQGWASDRESKEPTPAQRRHFMSAVKKIVPIMLGHPKTEQNLGASEFILQIADYLGIRLPPKRP